MVYLLLLTLAATVLSGMTLLAMEEHQGPLAPFFGSTPSTSTANQPGDQGAGRAEATRDGESEPRGEEAVEEAHEIFANIVLILVILHILGVVVASVAHRENLVRAMVTGNKRSDAI